MGEAAGMVGWCPAYEEYGELEGRYLDRVEVLLEAVVGRRHGGEHDRSHRPERDEVGLYLGLREE